MSEHSATKWTGGRDSPPCSHCMSDCGQCGGISHGDQNSHLEVNRAGLYIRVGVLWNGREWVRSRTRTGQRAVNPGGQND